MRRAAYSWQLLIPAVLAGPVTVSAQAADPTPAVVAAAASDSGQLAEIVVTAERRTENLQKTSVALQVLSGAAISRDGIVQPQDLTSAVPGLVVGTGGPSPQFYVRGVGDLSAIPLSNPAIATNLDGVYLAEPAAVNGNFFDLQRVEVLKGPQGTLYGRNASGGAINIISNPPRLGYTGGYLDLQDGNYSAMTSDGAVNVPIGGTFALRAAFQVVDRKGYLSDGFDDDRHQSVRLQGLWRPSSAVSLLLGADAVHMGGKGAGFVYLPHPAGTNAWEGVTSEASNALLGTAVTAAGLCAPAAAFPSGAAPAFACPALRVAPGVSVPQVALFNPLNGSGEHQDNDFWGVHAQFDWHLPFATLTVIPAYRSASERYVAYPSYPFFEQPSTSGETTLEARLSRDSTRLKWVGGVYFFNEDQHYDTGVSAGLVQNVRTQVSAHTRSYAAFGQMTYSIVPAWRLIAGLRYTDDEHQIAGVASTLYPAVSTNPAAICLNPTVSACPIERFNGNRPFRNGSWKLGTEFDLTQNLMLYLTASTGFKSGGFNQNAANSPPGTTRAQVYLPEKLLAFEAGAKNRFLHQRLQANLEAFYWIYQDHQEPHVLIDGQGNASFEFSNAGRARMYGLDPDITLLVTPRDKLHLLGEYLDSKYTSFSYVSQVPVTTGCAERPGSTGYLIDCSGFQLAHASKWSGSLSYEHNVLLPGDATLALDVSAQYASWRWLQIEFTPAERVPSYVVENASLTYTSGSGTWSVSVFGRNLGDRPVYTSGNANGFGPQLFSASIGPPRTYGASIHWSF